jgi:hypothetical protein
MIRFNGVRGFMEVTKGWRMPILEMRRYLFMASWLLDWAWYLLHHYSHDRVPIYLGLD